MRNRIRRALRAVLASNAFNKTEHRPAAYTPCRSAREVEGIIQHVDPVGRELPVLVGGTPINFYVPLDCCISVNESPAKMRLLQPRDRARLEFTVEHGVTTAHSITVLAGTCTLEA